jgi:hypothetical protein
MSLFTKALSKHSIGAYMELCREVGKSFEAVMLLDPVEEDEQVQSMMDFAQSYI